MMKYNLRQSSNYTSQFNGHDCPTADWSTEDNTKGLISIGKYELNPILNEIISKTINL